MLTKALFHELARHLSSGYPTNGPYNPMELLIRDNIAATLEAKIKLSMGSFGFLERHERGRKGDTSVTTFNYVLGHPDHRVQMQCSFFDESRAGSTYQYGEEPAFSIVFVNTAPEPEKTPEEEESETRRGGIRGMPRRGDSYRLDRDDFDPVALEMFHGLLSSATTEVMLKAIPERKASVSKAFKEGTMVYDLHNPDKVLAAHVVEMCGVNTVSADNEVCDMAAFYIAGQMTRWVHSSKFGTELEWVKVMKDFGRGRARPDEFGSATQAELDYIQGALVRIGAILRG